MANGASGYGRIFAAGSGATITDINGVCGESTNGSTPLVPSVADIEQFNLARIGLSSNAVIQLIGTQIPIWPYSVPIHNLTGSSAGDTNGITGNFIFLTNQTSIAYSSQAQTYSGGGSGLTGIPPAALNSGSTITGIDFPTNTLGTHGISGYLTNGLFVATGTY